MNENDLRTMFQNVPPVEIDDRMVQVAMREAKARRRRVALAVVSGAAALALVAGVGLWRARTDSVAIPDPRTSATTTDPTPTVSPTVPPTTTAPPTTTPTPTITPPSSPSAAPSTASRPATASAGATTVATYSGPTTELPASFGTVKVKVSSDSERGRATGYEVLAAPLVVCGLPVSDAPTLKKLTAARTIVLSAGETYNAQSVLEFADSTSASAFVAEMKRIQAACPKKPTLVAATRPLPVTGFPMDEGVVVGSYTPNTSDGTAFYLGRKGKVVVVTVGIVVAALAEKPQSEADFLFTAPILNVLSQV